MTIRYSYDEWKRKTLCIVKKEFPIIAKERSKRVHLGVFHQPYLQYILDGKKTIEARLTKSRIAPYLVIQKNDWVLLKEASGPVRGIFRAHNISSFQLEDITVQWLKKEYDNKMCVGEEFWVKKRGAKYATFIHIKSVVSMSPLSIRKSNRLSWIVL